MSAGVSNSSGSEDQLSKTNSKGSSSTVGTTDQSQTFNNAGTTTSSMALPAWAKTGNKEQYNQNAAATGSATDFLTSLLHDPYTANGGAGGGSGGSGNNEFGTAVNNLFETQLARARTGDAGSIGAVKQGAREASALTDAQSALVGQGTTAATSLLAGDNPNTELNFARSIAPTTQATVGSGTGTNIGTSTSNTNSLSNGRQDTQGQSEGSNSGYGITLCCFIFLEAYHGQMPWYVRRCRDEFATGHRVSGYRRMAASLVPLMRKSALVRALVWWLMIRPMTCFGSWLYGRTSFGWVFAPITAMWFGVWSALSTKEKTL